MFFTTPTQILLCCVQMYNTILHNQILKIILVHMTQLLSSLLQSKHLFCRNLYGLEKPFFNVSFITKVMEIDEPWQKIKQIPNSEFLIICIVVSQVERTRPALLVWKSPDS